MSLSTTINLTLKALHTVSDDMGTPTDNPTFTFRELKLSDGAGRNQADRIYHSRLSIGAAASVELDLNDASGAGLRDKFGNPLQFAGAKVVAFYNRGTNAADVIEIGGAPANAWEGWTGVAGSTFKVGPEGLALFVNPSDAGYPVTAGTGDRLKLANLSAGAVDVDVMIVGA